MTLAALQVQAESLVDGSAEAGKNKAITCAACHGAAGISANPLWPNIAGQSAPYLVAQLKAFKDGARNDALMTSQVMMLSEQDMADLAVYFESLRGPAQAVADPDLVSKGEALYRGGEVSKEVAACMACHGPSGAGNPAAKYPAIKGQHAAYTAKQLRDYASGARASDGKTRVMRDIAGKLSEDEIVALASYVQGLK
ncbi:MAG: c-type cytochrome [Gammaproteobacteria bacterium]|nr:c-type cytochrome [Gammaproteobacteria bacterium]